MEINRDGQLYSIERSQSMFNRMNSQEPRGGSIVLLLEWWPNNKPVSRNVCPETAQRNCPACGVQNASSNLNRQHRFELDQ